MKFRCVAGPFAAHRGTLLRVLALILAVFRLTVVQPFLVRLTVDAPIPSPIRTLCSFASGLVLKTPLC